mgnify:CR=1 FL=1|jgi:hypothetical protein
MRFCLRLPVLSTILILLPACGGGSDGGQPAIVVNQPPTLTLEAQISILEGTNIVTTAIGSDPEGQSLTFSLAGGTDKDLFSVDDSGVISFIELPDFEAPTDSDVNNIYEFTVQLSDSQNGSDTKDVLLSVQNAMEGRVIDAPLSGSDVFLDLNGDGIHNEDEPSGLTDIEGYFRLPALVGDLPGKLISLGGVDSLTDVDLSNLTLVADLPVDPSKLIVITPISTVLASVSTDEGKAEILRVLGISGTVDGFLGKDLWAMAKVDEAGARELQNINQQIGLLFSTAKTLAENSGTSLEKDLNQVSEAVARTIAELIANNGAIDLGSSTTIYTLLTDSMPATSSVSSLILGAVSFNQSELNGLLAGSDLDPSSLASADFVLKAQTTLQDAINSILIGLIDIASFLADAGMSNLFAGNDLFISQTDSDGDGIFDLVDLDDDNDNVIDELDAFPLDATESVDTDGDGIGDNADPDDDNDGIPDESDDTPQG